MGKISEEQLSRKITFLSFILSVGIVYFHAYNVNIYNLSGGGKAAFLIERFETVCLNLLGSVVPFFFMISGFLFFRNFAPERNCYLSKLKSRFRSLFIPYVIFTVIGYFYFFAVSNIPFISVHMNTEPMKFDIVALIKSLWTNQYSIVLWYVRNLLVMVILSPAVYFIMKNRKGFHVGTIVLIISFIISLSVNLKYGESTLVFQMNRLFNNTYFFAGAFLAINHKDWVYYKNRNITAIGSILLALCIICTVLFDFFDYNNVIKNIMIPVSVWMMSNAFYFRGLPKYLQISFFIYCVHEYILEAIEKLWMIAAGASPAAALTDFLLMPVICIFIVTVISIVIRKITPGIWKVITGGR